MDRASKEVYIITFTILLAILLSHPANAGFFDTLKELTGLASTTQGTNLSITITGTSIVTIIVHNESLVGTSSDPTEDTVNQITFTVTMSDPDGVNDLNDTSVTANFSQGGSTTLGRENGTCTLITGESGTNDQNYSCTIGMWYFDSSGKWNITVTGTDLGNKTIVTNSSQYFQFTQLQAITISPNALTFAAAAPGAKNVTSSNDPTLINNTGNYDASAVKVLGIDLTGEDIVTDFIYTTNFTVDIDTGGDPDAECDGTVLVNDTATTIVSATLNAANHSPGDGSTGQEQLYYCITEIPTTISSQVYSALAGGAWTISIT